MWWRKTDVSHKNHTKEKLWFKITVVLYNEDHLSHLRPQNTKSSDKDNEISIQDNFGFEIRVNSKDCNLQLFWKQLGDAYCNFFLTLILIKWVKNNLISKNMYQELFITN